MEYMGVDGCRGGWVYLSRDDNDLWESGLVPRFQDLTTILESTSRILVDMPIGLRDNGKAERLCDLAARAVLRQPRSSSVFPAPCRPALTAEGYLECCELNYAQTGRRLSKQSWSICDKIKEVDIVLREANGSLAKIRESHPEVCFWALNRGRAMRHNKRKTGGGETERVNVVKSLLPASEDIICEARAKYKSTDVARDDIIDALILAITAKLGFQGPQTLPDIPERDSMGLPMEIVYYMQRKTN